MRSPARTVLVLSLGLATAASAVAWGAPSATVSASASRTFSFGSSAGWDRVSVVLEQRRGGGSAGTSGAVMADGWYACVQASASFAYFHECERPTAVTLTVADGTASGRLRFTLTDPYSGDTAVVDVELTEEPGTPGASYATNPSASGTFAGIRPTAATHRTATARGSVRWTSQRGGRRTARSFALSGARATVDDRVTAEGRAQA